MTNTFTTPTGKELVVNKLRYIEGSRLRIAVLGAIKESNVKISDIDFSNLLSGNKDQMTSAVESGALDKLISVLIQLDLSEELRKALDIAFKRCTWDGKAINTDFFDDNEEAQGDYYFIAAMCLKVNVLPFIKPLLSSLQK
jgi:hypothetical protein